MPYVTCSLAAWLHRTFTFSIDIQYLFMDVDILSAYRTRGNAFTQLYDGCKGLAVFIFHF